MDNTRQLQVLYPGPQKGLIYLRTVGKLGLDLNFIRSARVPSEETTSTLRVKTVETGKFDYSNHSIIDSGSRMRLKLLTPVIRVRYGRTLVVVTAKATSSILTDSDGGPH